MSFHMNGANKRQAGKVLFLTLTAHQLGLKNDCTSPLPSDQLKKKK
jgi:hypothetical protein